jgi:DNA-binding response OmpR family regulator
MLLMPPSLQGAAAEVNPSSLAPLVLIADDEMDILNLVRVRLERSGFRVVATYSGDEALRLAREHKVDIAVLDVMMPGMTGLDVAKALRAEQPGLPIILLTARTEEADVRAGFAAGANAYVTKPFSPQELESRVTELLRRA